MKHSIYHILLATTAAGLLGACATHRQAAEPVTATPAPCLLTPDSANRARMDLTFHIPENTFNRRTRLVITPQLLVGDSVAEEYMPLVLDADIYGKKTRRLEVLDNYQDPYSDRRQAVERPKDERHVPYSETIQLPARVDTARVRAIVSTDGCGECTGIDTLDVASIVRPVFYLTWMEPAFTVSQKVMSGQGEARLQFIINKYDIRTDLGNNRAELDSMTTALTPVLKDTLATLNTFTIFGMASADGSIPFNTRLAENRANSAKQYIADRLRLTDEVTALMRVSSKPEGWQPVLDAMRADHHPDTTLVADILADSTLTDDDAQERRIRRLRCWNDIKEKYLAKDRKVEYTYSYTLRSFTTDSEILHMYATRPDAFDENELLRAASLMPTDSQKMDVYQDLLQRYPRCLTATNNLAYLYLRAGREAEARRLLSAYPDRYPGLDHLQLRLKEGGDR